MAVGAIVIAGATLSGLMPVTFSSDDVTFAGAQVPWYVPAGLLLLGTIGAYICGIVGLRHIGATVGSFLNLIEIPFAAILSWIIVAEALSGWQILGGVVILVGIVFVKLGDSDPRPGEARRIS